eukprot:TCONS_00050815-protein
MRGLIILLACVVNFTFASHGSHGYKASDACTTFSEFALVLDESKSIQPDDWKAVKNFASEIIQTVGISAAGNRAGIASFSDEARIRITCKEHDNTKDFEKAIEGLNQTGDYTNMEDGLIKGKSLLEKGSGCGERPSVFSKVLVILSDGIPNKRPRGSDGDGFDSLFQRAKEIRGDGTKIIAIGVGDEFEESKQQKRDFTGLGILRKITGSPMYVFTSQTFSQLTNSDFIKQVIDPICTDPLKTSVKPFPRTKPKPTQPGGGSKTKSPTTKPVTQDPTKATTKATEPASEPSTVKPNHRTKQTPKTPSTKKPTPTQKKPDTTKGPAPRPTTSKPGPPGPTEDPDTGICRCIGATESHFPALSLSVFDIEEFPGEARKDKLKAAITSIIKQRRQIKVLRAQYNGCKKSLRNMLLKTVKKFKDGTDLFLNIDECTAKAECKFPTWIMRLEQKKCKLEDELRWYEGTFGRIYDYGENAYQQLSG